MTAVASAGRWLGPAVGAVRTRLEHRRAWLIIVGVTALLVRLPYMLVRAEASPGGDSAGYLEFARELSDLQFRGMTRTPGYPAFLWLVGLLPGRTEDAAVVVQHLIGVALAVALVVLGWRLFAPAAGVAAGFVAALSPGILTLEEAILPDYLSAVLAFAGAAALALAVTGDWSGRRALVTAGLLFAGAAYVKPVGQALVLAAPLVTLAATRDWRAATRNGGLVAAVMVLALVPWAVRNAVAHGDLALSNQAGVTLFNRAFEVQQLPVPTDDADGRLVNELTGTARNTGQRPSSYVLTQLVLRGRSVEDALALERRLASTAIRRAPRPYLQKSASRAVDSIEDLEVGQVPSRYTHAPGVARKPAQVLLNRAGGVYSVWFLATAATLLALVPLLVPGRLRAAALALIVPGLLLVAATVLTHGGQWRYSMQIAPLAWLTASAGLAYVAAAVGERVRRDRRSTGA